MSVQSTRETMERYFASEHSDTSMMAEDVTFTVMATGQQVTGPDAILGMLSYFYHGAFEATAELKNLVVDDGKAVGEWDFVGTHTGEFVGVSATNKQVRVPLCVAYDLEHDLIKRGHIYFETPAFLHQVGAI